MPYEHYEQQAAIALFKEKLLADETPENAQAMGAVADIVAQAFKDLNSIALSLEKIANQLMTGKE